MGVHTGRVDLDGSGPFYGDLDVNSGTQNIPGNYTNFTWASFIGCYDNGWGTFSGGTQYWSTTIAGVVSSGTFVLDFRPAGTSARRYLVGSGNVNVPHNSDGTRPGFANYAGFDTDSSNVGDGTAVTWADAPSIARASVATWAVAGNAIAGTAKTLNTNRADASFTHDITYTFGSASGTIGTGVGASVSWTPPLSLLNQMTTTTVAAGVITTVTKQGSTVIGTTTSAFNLEAGAAIVPDFTTVTNSEAVAGVAANIGGYVQTISKLNLAITGAAGIYGSTITSYKIEVSGQTINAASGVTPAPLSTSGTVTITGTITDSRGRQKVKTVNITVLAYTPPAIAALSIQRALSGGTPDENGTYIRVNLNASAASLIVSTQRNALGYRISTRLRGTTTWTLKANPAASGITFNSFVTVGTYTITDSYDVLVEVYDDFTTTAVQLLMGVADIFEHWAGNSGVGYGKYWERGRQDVKGEIYFQRAADNTDWRSATNIGTAAQRDAVYGTPVTDPTRVALANRKVTWYNTDNGWWEMYYATTGLSGLTALGLLSPATSGWYPIDGGPSIVLMASGTQSVTGTADVTAWTAPGTGRSRRRGGTAWFTYSSATIAIQKYGRYAIKYHSTVQAGSGQIINYIVSSVNGNIALQTQGLEATYSSTISLTVEEMVLAPSETIKIVSALGTYDLNQGGNGSKPSSGEFKIDYLGAPLVSE